MKNLILVTRSEISYLMPFDNKVAKIPAGTQVRAASNLPEDGLFWAEGWANMTEQEESHGRNYGFLIELKDIEAVEG
jgi:hypothetical protein